MAKHNIQGDSRSVIGVFGDEFEADHAIDSLTEKGFEASPIPEDQTKTYRPNTQPSEILVRVECGDACHIARSILTDYGASSVASPSVQPVRGAMAKRKEARPILTQQDSERVFDVDGELEVKEGPYVEPDMTDIGYVRYW